MRLVGILNRYVFLEAFGLYVLGFFGFLGFLLINKLFLEAERMLDPQMPGMAIAMITLLEAPNFMTWSLPVATLFATLMSMGRLAKDNELAAMFTNGISLYRLFLPFLLLSSISVVAAYLTNEYLVTLAAAKQQAIFDAHPMIAKRDSAEPDPFITMLENGAFITAIVFDKEQGRLGKVVYDDWGKDDGKLMVVAPGGVAEGDNLILGTDLRSPSIVFDSPNTDELYESYTREPSMSIYLGADLKEQYTAIKTPQELTQTELADQSRQKKKHGENTAVDETDFHFRFSGPFASLAFALVAMPLSLRAPRDERLLGLIWCFMLVMSYYLIFFMCKLMGYNQVLPPWLAAWSMNIVFGTIALFIFLFSRK